MAMSNSSNLQQFTALSGGSNISHILKALEQDGAVVLKDFISPDQVRRFLEDTEKLLPCTKAGSVYSNERIRLFHGSKTRRLTNLTTVSPTFRYEILDHDMVHEICKTVFEREAGTYWLGAGELIEVGPGQTAQPLHRDQDEWPIFNKIGPNAPEACLNFLIAFTEFNERNGATRVIPKSNRWLDFFNYGDARDTVAAIMNAGDCLLLSGKTAHGAGPNSTDTERRIGLVFSMQCSYLTPEEAFPLHVGRDLAATMSARARSMIGLSSHFAKNGTGLWQGPDCTIIDI